jgi:hypothetical protein
MSLLMGILGVIAFDHLLDLRRFREKQLELACYSAAQQNIAGHPYNSLPENYIIRMDSVDVSVTACMKGLFRHVVTRSRIGNDSVEIHYLFAASLSAEFANAVVFSKPDMHPVVAGETKIKGDILMSGKQITRGNIFGLRNPDSDYLNGTIRNRTDIRAKFFRDTLLKQLFRFPDSRGLRRVFGDLALSPQQIDTLHDLFISGNLMVTGAPAGKPNYRELNIIVGNRVYIRDSTLLNRELTIYCDSAAAIGANAKIENLLLVSKGGVTIGRGTKCSYTQFFSTRNISADKVTFLYPSVLCCYVETAAGNNLHTVLDLQSSTLNGSAMLVCDITGKSGNTGKIRIDEGSKVQGLVYSENYAELKGEIRGTA